MPVKKYSLTGFDISTYCKITNLLEKDHMSYTISFGDKTYYCIIMSITRENPTHVYIDRVESNETCAKEGKTKDLLKIALWTIKIKFPFITKLTFKDDSHVECTKGIKTHKLNLSYDYILKYNKTWYETHFKAQLPEDLKKKYTESMLILDKPLQHFELMKNRLHEIEKYKYEYENAKSPRDFIQKLRDKYTNNYCHEVSRWLSRYMEGLKVNIFSTEWYINMSDIPEPPNYTIRETDENLRGGYIKIRKTIKRTKKFTFGPYEGGYSLGGYRTFEE